jgi:hypothetical protein
MRVPKWALSLVVSAAVLFVSLAPQEAFADDHIVPLGELQNRVRSAAAERARNIADIERVLSYPAAAQALQKSNVNQQQMKTAVATLSDAELARMADRARASEKDVQGGLIVGILALIGLIVVIIIVVAVVADNRSGPAHLETAV